MNFARLILPAGNRSPGTTGAGLRGRGHRGFTLLEVMVSLAIFALMAVVLGAAYINVLNSYAAAARSRDADEEAAFACQQLLMEPDVDKARQGDQFDTADGRHVVWSATIDPTTTADLFTVVFLCEVSGAGQEEAKKVTRTFNTLRPTWSDPAERTKLLSDAKDRIAEIQSKTANGFAPVAENAGGGAVGAGVGNRGGNAGKNGKNGGPGGAGPGGARGNRGGATTGPARNDGTVPTPPPNSGNGTNGNNPRRNNGNGRVIRPPGS